MAVSYEMVGKLADMIGFKSFLKQYFSLHRNVSQREGETKLALIIGNGHKHEILFPFDHNHCNFSHKSIKLNRNITWPQTAFKCFAL